MASVKWLTGIHAVREPFHGYWQTFLDPVQRHAWRRWTFDWLTPNKAGRYALLARAKDANGSTQPDEHDPNYGSYVINHPLPIDVFVDDSASSSK
jgi:hypothetical protein